MKMPDSLKKILIKHEKKNIESGLSKFKIEQAHLFKLKWLERENEKIF